MIPLGAIEQHGPHLPLAVDSVIAGALAERFCLRVPGSLVAPTLQLGCSSEHMDFCGTLSLSPATLRAVIKDVVSSLIRHGFTDIVIFSAHGGNDALLMEIDCDLKAFASPARITVLRGIERLGKVWSDASAAENIRSEISGAHAGEFETSIIEVCVPTCSGGKNAGRRAHAKRKYPDALLSESPEACARRCGGRPEAGSS